MNDGLWTFFLIMHDMKLVKQHYHFKKKELFSISALRKVLLLKK